MYVYVCMADSYKTHENHVWLTSPNITLLAPRCPLSFLLTIFYSFVYYCTIFPQKSKFLCSFDKLTIELAQSFGVTEYVGFMTHLSFFPLGHSSGLPQRSHLISYRSRTQMLQCAFVGGQSPFCLQCPPLKSAELTVKTCLCTLSPIPVQLHKI